MQSLTYLDLLGTTSSPAVTRCAVLRCPEQSARPVQPHCDGRPESWRTHSSHLSSHPGFAILRFQCKTSALGYPPVQPFLPIRPRWMTPRALTIPRFLTTQ